jgi:hypothetical protein
VASVLATRCCKLTSLTGSKGSFGEGASGIGSPVQRGEHAGPAVAVETRS